MAVSIDATYTGTSASTLSGVVVSSVAQKLVFVSATRSATDADREIATVTRAALPFTLVAAFDASATTRVEVWYLDSPSTGTAAVTMTYVGGGPGFAGNGVLVLSGAASGAPEDWDGVSATGANPTATVSSNAGAVVVDLAMYDNSAAGFGFGAGQTTLFNVSTTKRRAASYKTGVAAGSVTMSHTNTSTDHAYMAVSVGPPVVTGTVAVTLAATTAAATGTVVETVTGTIAVTLAATTAVDAGTHTHTATLAATLDATTAVDAGTHTHTATLAATLDATSAAAVGAEGTTGTAAATLDATTGAATGASGASGTLAVTLAAATAAATGTVIEMVTGTLAATLAATAVAATGAGGASGTVAVTFAATTAAATGTVTEVHVGTVAVTLASAAAAATATHSHTATLAATLTTVTALATGASGTSGVLAVILAALLCDASEAPIVVDGVRVTMREATRATMREATRATMREATTGSYAEGRR